MRHVDDAHHAKGDGEADRGEQQHAAEADPLEQIGGELGQAQAVGRSRRAASSAAFFSSGSRSGLSRNSSSRFLTCGSVVPPSARDRRQLLVPGAGEAAARRRGCAASPRGLRRSCSAAIAFSSERGGIGRGMLQRIARRGEPRRAVGAEQGQRAERRLDRAAQPVVDDDPLEAVGCDAGRPPRR